MAQVNLVVVIIVSKCITRNYQLKHHSTVETHTNDQEVWGLNPHPPHVRSQNKCIIGNFNGLVG